VTKQDRLEPHEQDRARDWGVKLATAIKQYGSQPVTLGD
jgi:hypothetical protein